MTNPNRGEVWLVDLGLAVKVVDAWFLASHVKRRTGRL